MQHRPLLDHKRIVPVLRHIRTLMMVDFKGRSKVLDPYALLLGSTYLVANYLLTLER